MSSTLRLKVGVWADPFSITKQAWAKVYFGKNELGTKSRHRLHYKIHRCITENTSLYYAHRYRHLPFRVLCVQNEHHLQETE